MDMGGIMDGTLDSEFKQNKTITQVTIHEKIIIPLCPIFFIGKNLNAGTSYVRLCETLSVGQCIQLRTSKS